MKEMLIINNQNIKGYSKILFTCENLESFEIDVDHILDINLICDKKGTNKTDYWSNNGYIKLHKDVRFMLSVDAKKYLNDIDDDYDINMDRFMIRIPKYLDIVSLTLVNEEKRKIHIHIPYGVVESNFCGVIEFSDCHSYELDKDKNILIKYGELSKMPKKEDICFEDVFDNWKNVLPNVKTDFLDFVEEKYYYKEIDGRVTVSVIGNILHDKKKYDARLIFYGVRDYEEEDTGEISFINLYKLATKEYFVQLGFAAEFKFDGCYVEKLFYDL